MQEEWKMEKLVYTGKTKNVAIRSGNNITIIINMPGFLKANRNINVIITPVKNIAKSNPVINPRINWDFFELAGIK